MMPWPAWIIENPIFTGTTTTWTVEFPRCPSCGTVASHVMHPHSFSECAAYKRGYEAGVAMAKLEAADKPTLP